MGLVDMIMPKMGESIIEATVIRWLKKVGDTIERDESVLEVATDKVDTEVPAVDGGILAEILVQEGEVAKVGAPIARIETNASATLKPTEKAAEKILQDLQQVVTAYVEPVKTEKSRFYSPLVMNMAKEEGISMQELETIHGTGKDGRVTKADMLAYISNRKNKTVAPKDSKDAAHNAKAVGGNDSENLKSTKSPHSNDTSDSTTDAQKTTSKIAWQGEFEVVEMDWMRKIIAQRMMDSQRQTATVTSFVEADVTNMVFWKQKIKHEFMRKEGEGITFTPLIVEAIAKALKEFPLLNSSIDGDKIIIKKDINIGLAVALQDGNLIVPVVKNADRYNIAGLTKYVNELIKKARNNKLKPEDLADGTYTLSNIGGFGNVMGTPILVQPQVGIMAAGAIRKKPAVIETEYGDTIGIRHFMFLSHSYDHRIIDGALGGAFVKKVADLLEGFDVDRKI